MLMFTLAISCHLHFQFTLISTCHLLSSPLLIYLMGLTFQVPMQYCSLQQQTLLPPPETSTTGLCFHFGLDSSFFLDLFLCSSPIAYWTHTELGGSSSGVITFCLSTLFMGSSRQEYWEWFAIPFSSIPCFVRTLQHDPSIFGDPTWHGSYLHWVTQGCESWDHFG